MPPPTIKTIPNSPIVCAKEIIKDVKNPLLQRGTITLKKVSNGPAPKLLAVLSVFIPIFSKEYNTEIDFFPTYPNQKSPYSLICKKNSLDGKNLSIKKIKISKEKPFCQLKEKALAKIRYEDLDLENPYLYFNKNNNTNFIIYIV